MLISGVNGPSGDPISDWIFFPLTLGDQATIEDFSVVNNKVGTVHIGDSSRVVLSIVIIGSVTIWYLVILAQHVVVSGLNHRYEDIRLPGSR